MTVENGKGYVAAEQKKKGDEPIGLLVYRFTIFTS